MSRPRRNDFLIPSLGVIFDCLAIECSFLFAYWLRFNTSIISFLPLREDIPPLDAYIYGSFVVIPVWLIVFNSRSMYGARRNVSLADELYNIVKLVTFGMLIVMSTAFFYRAFSYSRVVFGLLWISSILFIFILRIILYQIEKALYRKGRELRNAIIIGSNATANLMYESLNNHPLLGYRLAGYCAAEPCSNDAFLSKAEFLGTINEAPGTIAQRGIELALIALDAQQHPQLLKLMRESEGINVEFLVVPDVVNLMTSPDRVRLKEIEGIPFIKIKGMPMSTWGRIMKRTFDVIVSSILLIVCSPIFIVVAISIKRDSKGPVFFKQERTGLNGEQFNIWKFRSMRVNAEAETGPVWAKDHDPRRTKTGAFLRRTSLDEFPQLFNVLKGEMSLVGPRPERPHFVEQFKSEVPKYLDRHRMKTGMTGWAQVNGLRGNTSLEERIKYDVYYIENWSLGFDIKILLKTVNALFFPKNVH
jgi:exopolysaccharide biosynthesis polyprenyl glycosylphosphotransferase